MVQAFPNRSWAEIDLDILAANMQEVRRITSPSAEIMAVVKADAYGHGAMEAAKVFLENGAKRLAVSMLDEAIELRKHGITAPILTLGHTDSRRISEIINYDITQTVYLSDFAKMLSKEAVKAGKKVKIHIKIDTGMARIGYMTDDSACEEILAVSRLPGIEVEGIFTHFATADESNDCFVRQQFAKFQSVVKILESKGFTAPIKHVCNSAATLRFPEMHLDMVRAGLILYGMWPKRDYAPYIPSFEERVRIKNGSNEWDAPYPPARLRPAMTLKSSIILVKNLGANSPVSYGGSFVTERDSVIATIPIGYADGYSRRLSNEAEVLIRGHRVPEIGNICMDMCMIDVTDLPVSPKIGEEVVLFGTQTIEGNAYLLPIDEISDLLGTINYEITCLVGKRVPRVYLEGGNIVHMHSFIW